MSDLSGGALRFDNAAPSFGYADDILYIFIRFALGGIRLYPRPPHGVDGVIQGIYKDADILEEFNGRFFARFVGGEHLVDQLLALGYVQSLVRNYGERAVELRSGRQAQQRSGMALGQTLLSYLEADILGQLQ